MRLAVFYGNPYGGSGRLVYEITRRLRARHDVTLLTICPSGQGSPQLDELMPRRPATFGGFPLLTRPFARLNPLLVMTQGLSSLSSIYRQVAEHINTTCDAALVFPCTVTPAPILLQHIRVPSVLYMGEPIRSYLEPQIVRPEQREHRMLGAASRWLDRHDPLQAIQKRRILSVDHDNANRASICLAYSCYSREVIYRVYGLDAKVCYPGVDGDVFFPASEQRRDNMVLSVGSVVPTKGHDFVIRALGRLPERIRPLLVVAGDGSDRREKTYLSALAERCGVRLSFESSAIQADITVRYQTAKVVAFAPVMEPFGFVPLEAMACGTPVVGVREAGVRETICDGNGGYLVDRDEDEFAEKLGLLLTDESLRMRQGRLGREYVLQNWTWAKSVGNVARRLSEALG